MTKGLQLMSQIARLAREAQRQLAAPEDQQVAVEIKLAAELVLEAHRATPTSQLRSPNRPAHHD